MTRRQRRPTALLAALVLVAALVGSLTTMSTSSAFVAKVTNSTNTAATAPFFTCLGADTAPVAASTYFLYPPSGTSATVVDASGNARDGARAATNAAVGAAGTGPCERDTPNRSFTLSGSSIDGYISGPAASQTTPSTFTVELWFKTTTKVGGRLIGFGNTRTGTSTKYDRHIYMSSSGQLWFGVFPNTVVTVNSAAAYNDGTWHLATATLSSVGMRLYVDGVLAASNSTNVAQDYTGYWRIGYDSVATWTNQPSSFYFNGSVAYPAVYTVALTPDQVRGHYLAGS